MSTHEVGEKLVALCKQGKNLEAIQSFYAKEIISVEAGAPPGQSAEVKGIEAVIGKNKWWTENNEVHRAEVLGPYPHGDRFAVHYNYDVTDKNSNQRRQMTEVGLYTVKGDKIVKEEFFYPTA